MNEHPQRTVTVTGTGRADAQPDEVHIHLEVTGRGRTVGDALDALARAANRVHEAERQQRVQWTEDATGPATRASGPALRTTDTGLRPTHDRTGTRVTGHAAYQSIIVRVSRPAAASAMLAALATAGGEDVHVGDVRFAVADTSAAEHEARALAYADALARARQYAAAADSRLGAVQRIRDTTRRPGESHVPHPGAPLTRSVSAPAVDVSFSPGASVVSASVTVTWLLADPVDVTDATGPESESSAPARG